MATLDSWIHLTGATPRTLIYPRMELISGRDWEPPVLVGHGEAIVRTPNSADFTLTGRATDDIDTFRRIRKAHSNPYDTFDQFRLTGVDDAGVEWSMGWTTPEVVDVSGGTWVLRGAVQQGLSTDVRNATVADRSSVENIIELAESHPMLPVIGGFTTPVGDGPSREREHRVDVLGTTISFSFRPQVRLIAISCPTSSELPHPYAENWLAEPFRIIFGQSIYPRLVARNFGDGRAMVSLRRSPAPIRGASFAALWASYDDNKTGESFWNLYCRLLTFIARARDERGHPNFQENLLTQHYEEIAQAARGTRWVWALTLASTVEGQAKMLVPAGTRRRNFDSSESERLAEHIKLWPGSEDLKSQAIDAIKRTGFYTATRVLAELRANGVITSRELDSWKSMRNEVSHGTLISPWSQQEEDTKLQDLANLFHKLTTRILEQTNGMAAL
jgi:hypothetical protein